MRKAFAALVVLLALLGPASAVADSVCVDVHVPDSELRDFPYCVPLP